MRYPDESYNLRIVLDTKNYECTPEEIRKMEVHLGPLAELARDFPISDLYITVMYSSHSQAYEVKTSLVLTGRTLMSGDWDEAMMPAYERCIRNLVKQVQAYKDSLEKTDEVSKHAKGTRQPVTASAIPHGDVLKQAVEDGDYAAFRNEMDLYEDSVRSRVGRWVQRYPEVEVRIGESVTIADIVDEVFLMAFDRYDNRPRNLLPGEWLESLIDAAIKELIRHPDETLENVNFARSLTETRPAREARR